MRILMFTAIIGCFIGLFSCCKEVNECKLVPVKILRADCDRVIFQLLSSDGIGDPQWVNVQTGMQYENVFYCKDVCAIASMGKGVSDTLYVAIKKNYDASILGDCVTCQAISQDPPATLVEFTEMSLTPCQDKNY